jgi:hypothetical protein
MGTQVAAKSWWDGPWGSALRQIYVVMIAAALTAGLNQFLTMHIDEKLSWLVAFQFLVKLSEKSIRIWIAGLKA